MWAPKPIYWSHKRPWICPWTHIYYVTLFNKISLVTIDLDFSSHSSRSALLVDLRDKVSSAQGFPHSWYTLLTLLHGPFLWMGFNCLKATEPLREGNLLFTNKFPEIPGTHLIDLERLKGLAPNGFQHKTHGLGI